MPKLRESILSRLATAVALVLVAIISAAANAADLTVTVNRAGGATATRACGA